MGSNDYSRKALVIFDDVNILFSFIKDSKLSQNKIPLNITFDASLERLANIHPHPLVKCSMEDIEVLVEDVQREPEHLDQLRVGGEETVS